MKLVKTKHDKGLGLTVSGGIDRGSNYPVVSHLRLGGIADRYVKYSLSSCSVSQYMYYTCFIEECIFLARSTSTVYHFQSMFSLFLSGANHWLLVIKSWP